jgi:hypothetical protein
LGDPDVVGFDEVELAEGVAGVGVKACDAWQVGGAS